MKIGFLGLLGLLGLLFIGLKLGNVITWSWWLVLLPLYVIPAVLFIGVLGIFIAVLVAKLANLFERK